MHAPFSCNGWCYLLSCCNAAAASGIAAEPLNRSNEFNVAALGSTSLLQDKCQIDAKVLILLSSLNCLLVWELLYIYILHNWTFVRGWWYSSFRELCSLVCRSQLPVRWCYIVGNHGLAVASGDAERQWLWLQVNAAVLPVLTPVPAQWVPASRVSSFDGHLLDVSCASYVGDENQHEEGVSVDGEAYSPRFYAGYSANPSKKKKNTTENLEQQLHWCTL